MNAVGSFYDTYFQLAKQLYFKQYGNPTNCLQAKGNLQTVNNLIISREPLITNEINQANVDGLKAVATFLNQYISMNCNEEGTSTIIDVPMSSQESSIPDLPNYETDAPTTEGGSKWIWIAGAGLIAFIIYNNTKKGRRRTTKKRKR